MQRNAMKAEGLIRERQALFEGNEKQAAAYAKHRPSYSPEIFDRINNYAGPTAATDIALDVATGSGQAAKCLAKHYRRVVAQDISKAQIAQAKLAAAERNVEFQEGAAEASGLPDCSVDLVTVAVALHWFDIPRAFTEFARVLKPGGVLAIWGYDLVTLVGEPDANDVLLKLYSGTLGPYWDDNRRLIEDHYRSIQVPLPFTDVQRWESSMKSETTVGGVLGIIASWSGYSTYREAHPNKQDPLILFHEELKEAMENKGDDAKVELSYPIFMLLARKPV